MGHRRKIAVLTGSRAEYGLLYWTIKAINEDASLELILIVTGMHLSPEFGETVKVIESDGFPIAAKVETLISSDTNIGVVTSIGLGVIKIGEVLASNLPDILVLLGDRSEVLAAAVAALPLLIPVAHLHAGEATEGSIDENIRHAVTKLSHISFASTEHYADRLLQMGEEPWRVHISGATGLEHIHQIPLPARDELESYLGIDLSKPTLVVTHHPATLENTDESATNVLDSGIGQVLDAIKEVGLQVVITYPNSDSGSRAIIESIEEFNADYKESIVRVNLGTNIYLGLMKWAACMVGNSSSGIIEAGSFGLPVVNIGARQQGRIRGPNVIDVKPQKSAIVGGIRKALDPDFRKQIENVPNPYDKGLASETIVSTLKGIELGQRLLEKRLPSRE